MIIHCIAFCSDTNDFNATAFDMTFLAGGRSSIADIAGYIPIMDDEINEAPQQVFMILLEIQTAVNPDLIVMARTYSTCIIIDNDGECGMQDCLIIADLIVVFYFYRYSNWICTTCLFL